MSYHTHNLQDGDVFSAPEDLDAYSTHNDTGLPYHIFQVLDVEHATYMTPDFKWHSGILDPAGWDMHLVARCLACGKILNQVVNKYISLCIIAYGDEDGDTGDVEGPDVCETIEEKAKKWVCR